jgi:hypothetical protein
LKKPAVTVETLMYIPGKWERRWEGEPKDLSEERQKMNTVEWGKMMQGFRKSRGATTQAQHNFHLQLLERGVMPKPIEVSELEPAGRLRTCAKPEPLEPQEELILSGPVLSGWEALVRRIQVREHDWRGQLKEEVEEKVDEWFRVELPKLPISRKRGESRGELPHHK